MEVTAAMVKELRERTGAGMMQCKKALAESGGDVEKAIEALRKMGLSAVAKRAERTTAEGRIEAYVHAGNKIGVLVEVNCETDFVARTDDFLHLCRELALQVAATCPGWVRVEDVPAETVEEQTRKIRERLDGDGVAGADLEKQVAREVQRFYEEQVLLQQPNIRDQSRTIGDIVSAAAAKIGENIQVRRFAYFRLGGAA